MIREGTQVRWEWGQGHATGEVIEVHHETIEKQIKGNQVKREGTDDNPAYLIKQQDGTHVLKLQSEVERADD